MYTGVVLLFVTILFYLTSSTEAKAKDNGRIHYPGPFNDASSIDNRYGGNSDVPDECKDKTYCTIKPKDYPQEKFNKMFEKMRPIPQPNLVLSDLDDRQGDPEELDNCETIVKFEHFYKVKSKTGDWRVVVQAPEKNYVQKVRTETCMTVSEPCFNIYLGLPGYTTFCKQQYTTWEFVVEATDGSDKTEKIAVDLPTCCSCHYKEIKKDFA